MSSSISEIGMRLTMASVTVLVGDDFPFLMVHKTMVYLTISDDILDLTKYVNRIAVGFNSVSNT